MWSQAFVIVTQQRQRSNKLRSQAKQTEECNSQETVHEHVYMAMYVYKTKANMKHNVAS